MAQRILGIDMGATAVKAVLIGSTFRGYEILGAASLRVLPAAEGSNQTLRDRQVAAARELVAAQHWHPEQVIIAWPGASAASHTITLPFADPKRIEQTVQFEVEGQLPFDLADVAWDWQALTFREGKTDLYVGVVKKDELAGLLGALDAVELEPRVVLPAGPAYAALFGTGVVAGSGDTEILVDIGSERTSICILSQGQCEAARTFAGGGSGLTRALERELQLSPERADELLQQIIAGKASVGDKGKDAKAAAALQRALMPLARELRATLRAWSARFPGQRPVRRLVLAGEVGRLPGLPELLGPEVGGTVDIISFEGPAAAAIPPSEAPGMALALALALRGHQSYRAPRLNLRRGELAYKGDFEHLKGKLTRLGMYAGMVLVLAMISGWAKVFALSRQEALLDKALCDTTQKIVGKCYTDPQIALSVLKGKGAPTAGIPKISAVDVFVQLAQHAPSDVSYRMDKIDITKDKVHLQGTTAAPENVDRILNGIKTSKCFTDARSGGARKRSSDGKFEFSIDTGITCETPPQTAGGRK
jgi:general secretion pathway protein L